jgi:hypothetical protein
VSDLTKQTKIAHYRYVSALSLDHNFIYHTGDLEDLTVVSFPVEMELISSTSNTREILKSAIESIEGVEIDLKEHLIEGRPDWGWMGIVSEGKISHPFKEEAVPVNQLNVKTYRSMRSLLKRETSINRRITELEEELTQEKESLKKVSNAISSNRS